MKKIFEQRDSAALPLSRISFPQERSSFAPVIEARERHPQAAIKGDIRFCVTQREAMHGPITGHYHVETQDVQEPLFFLWHAQDGEVLNRSARSTDIVFDLRGEHTPQCWTSVILGRAGTGHLWTSVISVQVTDAEAHNSIVNGIFVQILVTREDTIEKVA